jgi:sulfur relay (sulfurtransferase) complex TusBCD TusD component (DsrE family)
MATMTVILGEPPYGGERAYLAMRFILTAKTEGHDINVFLFEEAVYLPHRGREGDAAGADGDEELANSRNLIRSVIDMGANVKVCGVCARKRSLQQGDLIEGASIGAMQDLIRWIMEADKVVSF